MNSAEQTVTWLIALGVLESPKKTISDPEGFLQSSLKDGVVLCRLLDRLLPGTIDKVSARRPLCGRAAAPAPPAPPPRRRGDPGPGEGGGGRGGQSEAGPLGGPGDSGERPPGWRGFPPEGPLFCKCFTNAPLPKAECWPCTGGVSILGGGLWTLSRVPPAGCKLIYATAGAAGASPRLGGDSAYPFQPLKDIFAFDASFS